MKEALKLALEALEKCRDGFEFTRQYVGCETLPAIEGWSWYDGDVAAKAAITAIKQALAAPEEKYVYGTPLLDVADLCFSNVRNTHDLQNL
jgi:hypothetical protein